MAAQSNELIALLVRTLLEYHGVGRDLTQTAAALGVHRSTVRYRLYCIGELTGLSPDDPRAIDALRDIAGPHR